MYLTETIRALFQLPKHVTLSTEIMVTKRLVADLHYLKVNEGAEFNVI